MESINQHINDSNIICNFCGGITIISTELPANIIYASSNENEEKTSKTNLYSICNRCNKFTFVVLNSILYNKTFSKSQKIMMNKKYDSKLMTLSRKCKNCNEIRTFKMIANDNRDLKFKIICITCDSIYYLD